MKRSEWLDEIDREPVVGSKEYFIDDAHIVIVCPYCGDDNQLDPPLLCCGEVHAEEQYHSNITDEVFPIDDLDQKAFEYEDNFDPTPEYY